MQIREEKLNVRDALELALSLYSDNLFEEAERLFRAIVEVQPSSFDAINGVALCLAQEGRNFPESLVWFDRAFVLLREEMVALSSNRARALGELGRVEEALSMLNGIVKTIPDYQVARYNRGLIHLQMRHQKEAIEDFDFVLEKEPSDDKARFARGFAHLTLGHYEEGFRDYECRLKDDIKEPNVPLWTGSEPLEGKTILVHSEMGLGDNIMFMRYVPLLQQRGARVVILAPDNMKALLKGQEVVGLDQTTWPKLDYWVRFMSLAYAFKTTSETIPPPFKITYDQGKLSSWKELLGPGLKIGICWTGSPRSRYDSYRSIPLKNFEPLLRHPRGARFFSIQKDIRESDAEAFKLFKEQGLITDLEPYLTDFNETAHAMANLDLVLTVDTSVAHLAGTVAVPSWVMLTSYRTYWLWVEKQTHSPWYPSVRLFRQHQDGFWPELLERVRQELKVLPKLKAA